MESVVEVHIVEYELETPVIGGIVVRKPNVDIRRIPVQPHALDGCLDWAELIRAVLAVTVTGRNHAEMVIPMASVSLKNGIPCVRHCYPAPSCAHPAYAQPAAVECPVILKVRVTCF